MGIFLIPNSVVAPMTSMHEDMHQRTRQQQQVRCDPQRMPPMLSKHVEADNRNKHDGRTFPGSMHARYLTGRLVGRNAFMVMHDCAFLD